MSRAVLSSMEKDETIKLAGLPWQSPRTFRVLPAKSLVSKVLCRRHNQALSPLDAEAGRLIEAIGKYDRGFNQKNAGTEIAVFSGEEVEKWMLKTVCGMVAAKQTGRDGTFLEATVPGGWISILTGERTWPPSWGLYVALPTSTFHHSTSFSFKPFLHPETERVLLVEMVLNGITLYLALGRPDFPSTLGVYRPRTMIFEQNVVEKYIEMSWSDTTLDEYVRFSRVGKYDGPPPDWPSWAQEG